VRGVPSVGCVSNDDTSPSAIVTRFINAIEANDLDAAVAMVSPDCEYDNVPMGKVFGPDGIRTALAPMLAACSNIQWIVHRQAAEGPSVFNERLDRFEMPFGWLEVAVTGVWEVHDGKITLWRDYFDEASYRKQLPGAGDG
jgi:limonene-1,2-epoxide hydrolase